MHNDTRRLAGATLSVELLCVIVLSTATLISFSAFKHVDMNPAIQVYDTTQWRKVDVTDAQQHAPEPTATAATLIGHAIEPLINDLRESVHSGAAASTSDGRGRDALFSGIKIRERLPWDNTLGDTALSVGPGGPQRVPFYVYDDGPFDFVGPCLDAKSYDVHGPFVPQPLACHSPGSTAHVTSV